MSFLDTVANIKSNLSVIHQRRDQDIYKMSEENDPLLAALNDDQSNDQNEQTQSQSQSNGETPRLDADGDTEIPNATVENVEDIDPAEKERHDALTALKNKLIEHLHYETKLKEMRKS